MTRSCTLHRQAQRGVTLLELILAISLVAAISAGMLTAMQISLSTLGRTQQRLEENRRAVTTLDMIRRHIGGAMPVRGACQNDSLISATNVFRGDAATLLLVTNESLTEGSRGYPRIAVYRILPNRDGTVRLAVEEHWFSGPYSTAPFCDNAAGIVAPVAESPSSVVLFERLGTARFEYRQLSLSSHMGLNWDDHWNIDHLPYAVRLYLEPAHDSTPRMPLGTITIPFHITRESGIGKGKEYTSAP